MNEASESNTSNRPATGKAGPMVSTALFLTALLLFVSLSALFWKSSDSRYVLFSNDGPLGAMVAEQNLMPQIMSGLWADLNWLGSEGLSPAPTITTLMRLLFTPRFYGRILPPFALFFVGICAFYCLRKLKLNPTACVLGALVAALNSDFLSTACWGVASQIVGFGACYLALGLLAENGSRKKQWLSVLLAGSAVGVAIMEAYDIGAIFSLFIAAYIFYKALFPDENGAPAKIRSGLARIAIVAAFAAFVSFHALTSLVGTQLKGIAGMQSDKKQSWEFATQWSLPKIETLQLVVPGIFGYRLDTPNGLNYWGAVGQNPHLPEALKTLQDPNASASDRAQATALFADGAAWRFSGTGYYAGIPMLIIAVWAAIQCFRKQSPFSDSQRREIKFWAVAAIISLLLSYGKYAPFFWLFYHLPYMSAIRNPTKFLHVFNFALIILFAYGVHGLLLAYMQEPVERTGRFWTEFKNWLRESPAFERNWLITCLALTGAGLLGWLVYASSAKNLTAHIQSVGIDKTIAPSTAAYSIHTVGLFALYMAFTTALLATLFSHQFSGARAKWGVALLGVLVLTDLARADAPWIVYWDVADKYASNPVIDLLRDKPYEHRVEMMPFGSSTDEMNLFRQLFTIEWHQQLFLYYNIQALKVVMEPRVTRDKDMYLATFPPVTPFLMTRNWELTDTRLFLGDGGDNFINALNSQFDPAQKRFRMYRFPDGSPALFSLALKPDRKGTVLTDYTVAPNPNGKLGVVEFTGTLPRAQLFSNWKISTNDDSTLKLLASPDFDPHQSLLVSDADAPAAPVSVPSADAGTAEINPNYRPKRVEISADVKTPAILFLADRYNPKWQVEVDGQPAKLLRADFIMRGVYLTPGKHTVVFHFVTPLTTLYVSLIGIAISLGIAAVLMFSKGHL